MTQCYELAGARILPQQEEKVIIPFFGQCVLEQAYVGYYSAYCSVLHCVAVCFSVLLGVEFRQEAFEAISGLEKSPRISPPGVV